uniref:Uncharacterized protein n=1 Tax=Parascaris equorum TaxID=6256 RepID=A0A914RCV7_PAREQ
MEVDDDDLKDTLLVHLMKLDRALWKGEKEFFLCRTRKRMLMRDRGAGNTIVFGSKMSDGMGKSTMIAGAFRAFAVEKQLECYATPKERTDQCSELI